MQKFLEDKSEKRDQNQEVTDKKVEPELAKDQQPEVFEMNNEDDQNAQGLSSNG